MTDRQAATSIALMLALLVSSLASLSDDRPDVWFAYDHGYFIRNEDDKSDVWETREFVAWARWNFWFMADDEDVFPFEMDLESNVPIDRELWYKPELTSFEDRDGVHVYSWLIGENPGERNVDGPCFFLAADPLVDPGVTFRRLTTPETVPPGVSYVTADIAITVDRVPTVNGVAMDVGKVWCLVFARTRPGVLSVTDCEIIASSGGYWTLKDPGTQGAWLDLWGSQVGTTLSVTLRFTVENQTENEVRFKPVAEINFEPQSSWFSQVRRERSGGTVSFVLDGPNNEHFQVSASVRGHEQFVNWTIEPMQYHGAVWAYWPLVVEEL